MTTAGVLLIGLCVGACFGAAALYAFAVLHHAMKVPR